MTQIKPLINRMLLILFCLLFILEANAQKSELARLEVEAHLAAYRLDKAESLLSDLRLPGYEAFYQANIQIYRFFSSQNPEHIRKLRADWTETIEAVEKLSESDSLKYSMLADLYCKRAGLEFMEKNYLIAGRYARLGHQEIIRCERRFPRHREQMKLLGLFEITFAAVPRKYQWLTQPLGLSGDTDEGLRLLNLAGEKSTLLRLEAQLLAAYVEKNMLNSPQLALKRLEQEQLRSGENLLLNYFRGMSYMHVRQNDRALAILSNTSVRDSLNISFPFWDYQLGKAYYFKGEQRQAQRYLARFLKKYEGNLFRSDAGFRLGMSLCLSGSYELGKRFFAEIINAEKNDFDQDSYAVYMAESFLQQAPSEAMLELFKARNRFDGGYFEEADAILKQLHLKKGSLSDEIMVEIYYRMGRLYQEKGNTKTAKEVYFHCIEEYNAREIEMQEQKWMPVYAQYYLGEIALKERDFAVARDYYKAALQEKDYFYQAGLENRL